MRPPQRNRRLQFEVMESREALSSSLAGVPWLPPSGSATRPPQAAPAIPRGVLAVSLTTDHSSITAASRS